ncbi:MAG: MarR family winged helix-turn-helix transcriptional regulator [Clostridiales bacterium]|nr:MarR family winged helix-turn-helix transcriptional regulator [Clostridiales bacterium]
MGTVVEQHFDKLYLMFRANYYRQFVKEISAKEGSLSATESYCVELIHLMKMPTVSDFANFLGISVPNANYKINSLVSKGYVIRQTSEADRREQHLRVTDKFLRYYGLNDKVISRLMQSIQSHFSEKEIEDFGSMLGRVVALMEQTVSEESEEEERV